MLNSLSDIFSGCGTIFDRSAAAGVNVSSMGDYFCDDSFKTNLPYDTQLATACLCRTLVGTLCVHCSSLLVCRQVVVVRRPSGRVGKCSCVSGATKVEEGPRPE